MKNYLIFIYFIAFLNVSCSTHKFEYRTETIDISCEDAIQNSINDYKNTKLFSKGKFFIVFCKSIDEDLIEVSIMEDFENKYIYSPSKKIEEHKLPNRALEVDSKLFVWWVDGQSVNENVFDLLKKYNMLKDDEGGWLPYWDPIINDRKKVTYYYICKRDLKYQRIVTNKGKKPNIKCGSVSD